ncbi:MAG TPA: hemolysin family protein [Planctomycetota bacterium]|jgi:CBS domain containing-hemolysin-like protein
MSTDITLNLLVIGLLILANAFFVATEFALVRVRRTRIDELLAEGNTSAKIVKDAIDRLNDYLSATQVGITVASLALGWIGEPFLANVALLPLLQAVLPEVVATYAAHAIAVALALFFITYLHVVVGELVPRSVALQYPDRTALYLVRPMRYFMHIFHPLSWLLLRTSTLILRTIGIKAAHPHALALSEEELLLLLSESKKAGVVSEDEQRMLQKVFRFHDKTVREIMVPRPDITALDLRANESEIQRAFQQGYSRLPAYDGNLDNIKGIVYVKDLIYTLQNPKLIKLVDLLREGIFVPENKPVHELLREFQRRHMHIAMVVDEFGMTTGLVTLEDVIEEIVGEIQDEYDAEPAQVERLKDGAVIFEGKADIDRFKEIFPEFTLPEGSYDTIAGLVFQVAGHVPRETEVIRHGDLVFRITKREGRRLRKITVWRVAPAAPVSGELLPAAANPVERFEEALSAIESQQRRQPSDSESSSSDNGSQQASPTPAKRSDSA